MRRLAALTVIGALAACSPSASREEGNAIAAAPAKPVAASTAAPAAAPRRAGSVDDEYPTVQPDGSPLTEAYCVAVDDTPDGPFPNTKTCLMVACDKGDAASCTMAETYNGNLWSDGVPDDGNMAANSD